MEQKLINQVKDRSLVTGGYLLKKNKVNGRFERTRKPFSLDNFNDGYVDNRGRFRVYLPNHPRAYHEGYILREIVAYEAYNNTPVLKGMCVHHKDGNRLNDSKDNLVLMPFGAHTTMHKAHVRAKSLQEKICKNCGKTFQINSWRLHEGPNRGTFCSQDCYKKHPRTSSHKQHISDGLKRAYARGAR